MLTIILQTPEDAEAVLTRFKEQGFVIGNRPVRVERADGKSKISAITIRSYISMI